MTRALLFLPLLGLTVVAAPANEPVDILLFTADDLHSETLGVYGGQPDGVTPNLDAFAAESMLFKRAHVNTAICAPCRAIIATGRYGHRSGAMGFMPARDDVPDLVTAFQEAGYHAGILGKVGHSTPKASIKWDYAFDQKDLGDGRSPTLYYERSLTFLKEALRKVDRTARRRIGSVTEISTHGRVRQTAGRERPDLGSINEITNSTVPPASAAARWIGTTRARSALRVGG